MLEADFGPYGVLLLAGLCVLLVIWIHAQQTRRRTSSLPETGRESMVLPWALYSHRAADDLSYSELEELSRDLNLRTFRIQDDELPTELLSPGGPKQLEMLLRMPGDTLMLILNVVFAKPCTGKELDALLVHSGLELADDGLYGKSQTRYGSAASMYYVANHTREGSFQQQGNLVDAVHKITLFTQLPLPVNGLHVWNRMLQVAEDACEALGGKLLDEKDEPLTLERSEALARKVEDYVEKHSTLDQVAAH